MRRRTPWTSRPSRTESGRAKYTSSNTHSLRSGAGPGKGRTERTLRSSSTTTISPGSTSRTKVAPTMSRAGDSEASTQPSGSAVRPRHRGRKPWGSRTPMSRWPSVRTRAKAPSASGSTLRRAVSRVAPPAMAWASSSASASLSLLTVPGSMHAFSARAAVLVRLPLWPRANWPPSGRLRCTGWALAHVEDPVVE